MKFLVKAAPLGKVHRKVTTYIQYNDNYKKLLGLWVMTNKEYEAFSFIMLAGVMSYMEGEVTVEFEEQESIPAYLKGQLPHGEESGT